jgi:2-hydroxy-3-oxopropionate reductase
MADRAGASGVNNAKAFRAGSPAGRALRRGTPWCLRNAKQNRNPAPVDSGPEGNAGRGGSRAGVGWEGRMARVSCLGTGLMGAPMAANLLAAGHAVTAWNRTPEKTRDLVARGARAAAGPAEAVRDADAVLIMLTDDAAVSSVLEAQGVADALPEGSLAIDCSSIRPATAKRHAAMLAERGIGHLDAPVSGGPSGAEAASLAIMVGGRDGDWARGAPILQVLGRPTLVGPPGAGQLAKLANQAIVALAIGAVSEGLLLAHQGGADPAKVREAMTGGFADSKILQIHGEKMLARRFVPGGAARVHLKDLRNILEAAEDAELELPLTRKVHDLFQSLVDHGGGDWDHSALLTELERLNAPARLGDAANTAPD